MGNMTPMPPLTAGSMMTPDPGTAVELPSSLESAFDPASLMPLYNNTTSSVMWEPGRSIAIEACDGKRVEPAGIEVLEEVRRLKRSTSGSKLTPGLSQPPPKISSASGSVRFDESVMYFGLFGEHSMQRPTVLNSTDAVGRKEQKGDHLSGRSVTFDGDDQAPAVPRQAPPLLSKSMRQIPRSPRTTTTALLNGSDIGNQVDQVLQLQEQLRQRLILDAKAKRLEDRRSLEEAKASAQDSDSVAARKTIQQQQLVDNWRDLSSVAVRQLAGIARQGELQTLFEDPPTLPSDSTFGALHAVESLAEVQGLHAASSNADRLARVAQFAVAANDHNASSAQHVPNPILQWVSVLAEDVESAAKTEDAVRAAKARTSGSIANSTIGERTMAGKRRGKVVVSLPPSQRLVIHLQQTVKAKSTRANRFLQQESQQYAQLPPLSQHIVVSAEGLQTEGKEMLLREQQRRESEMKQVEAELTAQLRTRKKQAMSEFEDLDDQDDDCDADDNEPETNLEPDELATQAVDAMLHAADPKLFGMNGFDTDTLLYPQFSELLHEVNRAIKKDVLNSQSGRDESQPLIEGGRRKKNVQDRIEQNLLVRQIVKKDPAADLADDPAMDLKAWRNRSVAMAFSRHAKHTTVGDTGLDEDGDALMSVNASSSSPVGRSQRRQQQRALPTQEEAIENEVNLGWRHVQMEMAKESLTGTARMFGQTNADRRSFPFAKASW
jgi:hypothetical protein